MKLLKNDQIELEILNRLAISPTYGYDIYKLLAAKGIVNQKAEVYKVIRNMKNAGLIYGKNIDIPYGYEKIMLYLTEEGKTTHYEYATMMIKQFEDFVGQFILKELRAHIIQILPQIRSKIPQIFTLFQNKEGNQASKIDILIDFSFKILPWQHISYIYLLAKNNAEMINLFIKEPEATIKYLDLEQELDQFIQDPESQSENNPKMMTSPEQFDMIISVRYTKRTAFEAQLLDFWRPALKSEGILIVGTYIEGFREDPDFRKVMANSFTGIHQTRFLEEFRLSPQILEKKIQSESKIISNKTLIAILKSYYDIVFSTNVANFIDIFIASNPCK